MKIYLIIFIILIKNFPVLSNEIDNKGLICDYREDNKSKITKYYWFAEGKVYKVWFDKKLSLIQNSIYPAYYKLTPDYIRFYKIYVMLESMEFTNKTKKVLGQCKFIDSYQEIEGLLKN